MRFRTAILAALTLSLAACGKAEPPAPPVEVQASEVEPLIHFASGLEGKRVILDGYISFDNGPNGQAVAIGQRLTTGPNGAGDQLIRLDLKQGEGPSELHLPVLAREHVMGRPELPEIVTFDLAKATFQDTTGIDYPLTHKVRVTGRLVYARAGNAGLMAEDDPRSPTGHRFKPSLTDVVLETPTN